MLVFIGASISFSTLHSHHDVEWNHSKNHVDSEHCLTESSNVCPICGYLFNADAAERSPQLPNLAVTGPVATISDSQQIDSFSGITTGRSPPVIG